MDHIENGKIGGDALLLISQASYFFQNKESSQRWILNMVLVTQLV
jgi:hypothetical protein